MYVSHPESKEPTEKKREINSEVRGQSYSILVVNDWTNLPADVVNT